MLTVYNNLTTPEKKNPNQECKENIQPNIDRNLMTPQRIHHSDFSKVSNLFSPFHTESKINQFFQNGQIFQSEILFQNQPNQTTDQIIFLKEFNPKKRTKKNLNNDKLTPK